MTTCLGTKANGERCTATLGVDASGYCMAHDPARREQWLARQSVGGAASAEAKRQRAAQAEEERKSQLDFPAKPKSVEDAEKYLSWLTDKVVRKLIDARTGECATKSLKTFIDAARMKELKREVEQLRVALAEAKASRRSA